MDSSTAKRSDKVVSESPEANISAGGAETTIEPVRPEPIWQHVTFGERLSALIAVRPVAIEAADTGPPRQSNEKIRVLRWNYTRLFAFAWAGLSLAISLWNAPRPGGPTTVDLFFLMAGLLYMVFAVLNALNGTYWRSFLVVREFSSLPFNRLGLLATCAAGGLLQFVFAATLVGIVFGIGGMMRR